MHQQITPGTLVVDTADWAVRQYASANYPYDLLQRGQNWENHLPCDQLFFGRERAGKDTGAAGRPARHVGGFHTCRLLRAHGHIVTPSSRLCRFSPVGSVGASNRLRRLEVATGDPHPCAAMDFPLRCSYRDIPCGAITPHEVWNLDNREGK